MSSKTNKLIEVLYERIAASVSGLRAMCVVYRTRLSPEQFPLRKQAYSNKLKISPRKK